MQIKPEQGQPALVPVIHLRHGKIVADAVLKLQMADLSQQLRESQDELHGTKELHASLRGRVDHYAAKIQVAFPPTCACLPG